MVQKMKCKKCNKEMDEESQDFCEEYEIDWCLNCCGKDMEENAEKGIIYHLSIPIYSQ